MVLIVRGFIFFYIPNLNKENIMNKLAKDFGNKIREIRKQQGISQEGLADLAELDRTYIGGIERGIRNPSLKNIAKIAKALRVQPRELFNF